MLCLITLPVAGAASEVYWYMVRTKGSPIKLPCFCSIIFVTPCAMPLKDFYYNTVTLPLGTGGTSHTGQTGHTEESGMQPQLRKDSLPSLELRPSMINSGRCPLKTIVFAYL